MNNNTEENLIMNQEIENRKLPSKQERHKRFGSVDPIAGNKPTTKEVMVDLQNKPNDFLFELDAVGICNVKYPLLIHSELEPTKQTTIGQFKLTTHLDRYAKGINMSRLTEQLDEYHKLGWVADCPTLAEFAKELAVRMKQKKGEIEISFPWFFERSSPALEKNGLMHAEAMIRVVYEEDQLSFTEVGLTVTVTTLCPCSKEISEYSAHNQRGILTIRAVIEHPLTLDFDWKVKLLHAAESNASSVLYPVLKRPDEKMVTERAYENPRFVEDMVRLVAADLYEMDFIRAFTVECRNEESIHLHDAIARMTYSK
jgi:GTP cyclohydrolase I